MDVPFHPGMISSGRFQIRSIFISKKPILHGLWNFAKSSYNYDQGYHTDALKQKQEEAAARIAATHPPPLAFPPPTPLLVPPPPTMQTENPPSRRNRARGRRRNRKVAAGTTTEKSIGTGSGAGWR